MLKIDRNDNYNCSLCLPPFLLPMSLAAHMHHRLFSIALQVGLLLDADDPCAFDENLVSYDTESER